MDPVINGLAAPHPTGTISGGVDSNGNVTSVLTYRVATESDARDYLAGQSHPTLGIPEESRSWTEMEGCLGFEVAITYKGTTDSSEGEDIELDASFSEEPIESHPNFLDIMARYKGQIVDGEVTFPKTITAKEAGGLKKGKSKEIKNPMFGVKTYLVLSAVVRKSWVSSSRPRLSSIGKIVKSVPGGFATPEDHDWMIMPPKSRKRGGGKYQNTVEYLLSPLGGWTEGVYELMEGKWDPDTADDSIAIDRDAPSREFGEGANPSNRPFGLPGSL